MIATSPVPRVAARLALTATVLATLSALLAAMAWRLCELDLRHAWPWPGPRPDVGLVLLLVGPATNAGRPPGSGDGNLKPSG